MRENRQKKNQAARITVQHLIYFKHLSIQYTNQESVIHLLSRKFENFELYNNQPQLTIYLTTHTNFDRQTKIHCKIVMFNPEAGN